MSIKTRVRLQNIRDLFMTLLFLYILIKVWEIFITIFDKIKTTKSFAILIIGALCLSCLYWFVLCLLSIYVSLCRIISPDKAPIFKKFGDEMIIQEILDEIENDIVFKYRNYIVSSKYVYDKKSIERLIRISDITNIYSISSGGSTNAILNFSLKLETKNGYENTYNFGAAKDNERNFMAQAVSRLTGLEIQERKR